MIATPHQRSEVYRLARSVFGPLWRPSVREMFAKVGIDFTAVSDLSNFDASWLIDELEIREKGKRCQKS